MKKILLTFVLVAFTLLCYAQKKAEWKLSTHTWSGAGWTGKWEYKYDSNFFLTEVKYYQDKKLFTVSKNFTHNKDGNITSYEDVYLQGADPQKFYFTYDSEAKLKTKKTVFFKNQKENYTEEVSYEWAAKKVTLSKLIITKKGNSTSTVIYNLDENKNILSRETKSEFSSENQAYKEIGTTPNPYIFVDYPYHGEVKSTNNSTPVVSTTLPSSRKIILNKAGLTGRIIETIDNGKYNIVNTDTYTYLSIKSSK